jgi:hypothetical protein
VFDIDETLVLAQEDPFPDNQESNTAKIWLSKGISSSKDD